MMNKKSLALLCTLAVMGSTYSASAEEQKNVGNFALDEVVVTATRSEQSLLNTSANVSIVTAAEIERMHYITLEDTLRTMTNIQFLDYNQPGHNIDRIRINGSDTVVVLLNGVRISGIGDGGFYPFDLISDMSNIERIEVLKGAAAVLYGSDAKGGVINIITKDADVAKTKVAVEGGDFGHEGYKFSTEGSFDGTSYRVYGQKSIDRDFESGDGIEWDVNENAEYSGVMLKHEFEEGSSLVFNYDHNDGDYAYYDPYYKQDVIGDYKTKNMQIIYTQKLNDNVVNTLSYNNNRDENFALEKGDPWVRNNTKQETINDTITATIGEHHIVTFGYEKSKGTNLVKSRHLEVTPDWDFIWHKYNQVMENEAFFLQDDWKITDKWNLISGVRHDKPSNVTHDWVDFPKLNIDPEWSSSFNLTYKFDEDSNVYIAYNDYFVLPSMGELYNDSYGNVDLLPEIGKNYEAGLNHMLDDRTLLNMHYFKRDSDQNIGFSVEEDCYVNDSEKANGFDIQVDRRFDDNWSANLGYSRLDYTNDKGTTDRGYLPKNSVVAGLSYTDEKWDVGMDARGFLGRDGDHVAANGWPSDHYWVVNMSASYKPVEQIKVYALCRNLFDKLYAEQTQSIWGGKKHEWYSAPGRNFVVGVEYSF